MIVIGDVHGCFDTLMALLNKLPDDKICFVGDLIDRGPKSKDVVNLVINEGFDCVRGNHEDMMIKSHIFLNIWNHNGGFATQESYSNSKKEMENHRKWMTTLPLYKEYDDGLIVSHSSCAKFWNKKDNAVHAFKEATLWGRDFPPQKIEGKFNIFGHTILKEPNIDSYYACIDTGCFVPMVMSGWIEEDGGGFLTALQYPQLNIFQQKCIDKEK